MNEKIIIRRRHITSGDLELIRQLIEEEGEKGRSHISRELCRIWDWRQPNGLYKEIACRDLLRRLEHRGFIKLPPMLCPGRRVDYQNKVELDDDLDTSFITLRISDFRSIKVEMVRGTKKEGFYNGLIGNYHYLSYRQSTGEHLKYLVYGDERVLSCSSA